jgi:hypothetical protein
MEASKTQLAAIVSDIRCHTKNENSRVRSQGGWITVFGSEVECLRVFKWRVLYKLNEAEDLSSGETQLLGGCHYVTYKTKLSNDFETE